MDTNEKFADELLSDEELDNVVGGASFEYARAIALGTVASVKRPFIGGGTGNATLYSSWDDGGK